MKKLERFLIKVSKFLDLIKAKYMVIFKQKIYKGEKYNIKYVFEENKNSEDLVILFTACTKVGQKARYNYVKTVENFKCNKLFILDDFGFDFRGAYYLGKNKDFAIESDVNSLINKIEEVVRAKKMIFMGSSKGGYSALYFGLPRRDSIIIAGAPQYKLGSYLNLPGHKKILEYIMGDDSRESIEFLDNLMKGVIKSNKENNNYIHLHYSNKEETYESDLKPLIEEINKYKFNKFYDIHNYENHSDLTRYFPAFAKDILKKYIDI